MKKIVFIAALLVGCLSCFGGNWEPLEDENIQALALVGKGNSIFSVGKSKEKDCCVISLEIPKLTKLRKSNFIEVYVDGVHFKVDNLIFVDGKAVGGRISDERTVTIINAKKRIKVKYSGRTFEFIP